jgi:hypothetical protein
MFLALLDKKYLSCRIDGTRPVKVNQYAKAESANEMANLRAEAAPERTLPGAGSKRGPGGIKLKNHTAGQKLQHQIVSLSED